MKKTKEPQSSPVLQKVKSGSGPQLDFSGQVPRNAGQRIGQPEQKPSASKIMNAMPAASGQPRAVRVFRSQDPKLHSDASFGTVPGTDARVDGTPATSYLPWPGAYR